jgi:electron-transferring-flavoprotein dehydrogenase
MRPVADRETLDLDILIVGGGPAGLSAALRLSQLQATRGGDALSIAVLEKSRETGAHMLSGAVLDPSALRDLLPDFLARGAPLETPVTHDAVHVLTPGGNVRLPIVPPPLRNHGHYVISLNRFAKWLGQQVEAAGVDIFTGFAGAEVLYDGASVVGVRTGDRGVDKQGRPKPSYEPGVDVRAKVTIFCDGVRGNLTKSLVGHFDLGTGRQPQVFALGIKELWEVPKGRLANGSVIHTMGYPLRMEEFGGGFVYALSDELISLGFVAGLDYKDPMFDPHLAFQRFKLHPFVRAILDGGKMIRYGAKALPEGGWYSVPRVHMDGALIAGDAGGFLNSMRLKGIHLAMRTGMLAAEAAFDAVIAGDVSASRLEHYQRAIDAGPVRRELYPVRNVHQAFGHGLAAGVLYSGLALATNGWWVQDPMPSDGGYARMQMLSQYYAGNPPSPDATLQPVKIDRQLTFDKLTNVHFSGTRHTEDQPSHLIVQDTDICRTRCRQEYGNPCTRFCPANVYEMVDDGVGGKKLHINASNCVHCKTCDVMDPYQIITWVTPEGGGGPRYDDL